MKKRVYKFTGKYLFLSNFYEAPIEYKGLKYQNSEAAFQAQKTLMEIERLAFCDLNPSQAKQKGRRVVLRFDWEDKKDEIMYEIVKAKFEQNLDLKQLLLNTQDMELVEGNDWGDIYWGRDFITGAGLNKLGFILMRVREELKKTDRSIKYE